jgi:hypothetical protein
MVEGLAMTSPRITLQLQYGSFGEKTHTVCIPINDHLRRELMEPVEHSDEPMSLLLASPGMYGGKGDALTIRKRAFKLRKQHAEEISHAIVAELVKLFGYEDERDGYKIRDEG